VLLDCRGTVEVVDLREEVIMGRSATDIIRDMDPDTDPDTDKLPAMT